MLTTAYSAAAWADASEADSASEADKASQTGMDADTATMHDATAKKAGWFSPGRLLLLFSCINMMIYVDRGAPRRCSCITW